jgi:sugar O-acyltransferase (sialic acid O-acetyltransferase NeuD family)
VILAFYGAGAMGREFKYVADETGEWSEMVFIDDHAAEASLLGCPVLGFQVFRKRYSPDTTRFVITIGEPKFRREAFERMEEAGYQGARLVHPSAYISPDAEVGEGAVIGPGVFIGSLARIGKDFYAAKGAAIGHDAIIRNHTRVGVGAFIGGHTVIGENAFIGSGAMLKDRICIGDYSVVAIGSAVFCDVADYTTVMGNPARITNEGSQGLLYAPSRLAAEQEAKETEQASGTGQEAQSISPERVAELYWEVFSGCFEGIDFNPVSFRFHDDGWDSIAQMNLICRLEETFGISFKGRETMKINSYRTGLDFVWKKLEESGNQT